MSAPNVTLGTEGTRKRAAYPFQTWLQIWLHWFTFRSRGFRDGMAGVPAPKDYIWHELQPRADGAATPQSTKPERVKLAFLERENVAIAEERAARVAEKTRPVKEHLDGECSHARYNFETHVNHAKLLHGQHLQLDLVDPERIIPMVWYSAIQVGAVIGEIEFNSSAFESFELQLHQQYLIAAGISLLVLPACHIVGVLARQREVRNDASSKRLYAGSWVCMALALTGASVARGMYIDDHDKSWLITLGLAALNAVMLAGTALAAAAAHDSKPDIERIAREKKRVSRKLERAWRRWKKVSGSFDAARARYLEKLNGIVQRTISELVDYRQGVSMALANIPEWFSEPLTPRLFADRSADFGPQLHPPPRSIEDLLQTCGLGPVKTTEQQSESRNRHSNGNGSGLAVPPPSRLSPILMSTDGPSQ